MTAGNTTPGEHRGAALDSKAARAVLWNYASFASGKVLVLVTMAVLARLLTPEDFGIVGFATVAIAYLSVLRDLGLGAAVIQRREDLEESAQTVFTLNLILGALLTAVTAAAAPLVADFFREPMVVPLLRVLSLTFLFESLGAIHVVLLRRDLRFRRKLVPDTARAGVKGVVAVTAAALGAGVWALIWGQLAGALAGALAATAVTGWRPRFELHRRLIRPLLRFGLPLVATDVQYAIWLNADYVIIGRLLGETALGVYTIAYRLPELLVQSIWRVVAGAVFPFFSAIQKEVGLLKDGFLATVRYSLMAVVPICLGLFVAAEPIVLTVFGEAWREAIPVLRIMAVFSLVGSIGVNVGDVYKAIGRPDILAKLGVVILAVLIPALLVGARWGIVGVAWAHAAVSFFDTGARLVVTRIVVGIRPMTVLRQAVPAAIGGAVLLGVSVPLLVATSGLPAPARLAVISVAGVVAYTVTLIRVDDAAAGWVRARFRTSPEPEPAGERER
jgi:O-antigen/teichoic acid export membrane protein